MNDSQNITKGHAAQLKLDERNHVANPFLDRLHGLGWKIIYDKKESAAL